MHVFITMDDGMNQEGKTGMDEKFRVMSTDRLLAWSSPNVNRQIIDSTFWMGKFVILSFCTIGFCRSCWYVMIYGPGTDLEVIESWCDFGVQVRDEGCWNFPCLSKLRKWDSVKSEVQHPLVGLCLDLWHFSGTDWPYLRKVASWILRLSVLIPLELSRGILLFDMEREERGGWLCGAVRCSWRRRLNGDGDWQVIRSLKLGVGAL